MDLQRVAGLGTFDVERAGLRIDLGEVELWRDRCVGDGERVVGGVTRAGDHRVPGLDAQGRRMGIAVSEINLVAWIVPHFGRHGRPGYLMFDPLPLDYFLGNSPRTPSLPGAPLLKYLLSKSTPNSGESAGSTMVVLLRAKVRDASMVRRNAKNSGARLSAFA